MKKVFAFLFVVLAMAVTAKAQMDAATGTLTKDAVTYFVTLSYDYATAALERFEMKGSYQYVKRGKFNETRMA